MKEQHDLAKWLEGKMSGSELDAFERSAEFAEYDKIRRYSAQLQGPDFNTDALYQNVVSQPKKNQTDDIKVVSLKANWFLRIAAVLVIGVGLFFAAKNGMTETQTAAYGKEQTFQLPDASQVTLNSGSEIEYKKWNWRGNRCLQLDGEAFFKVTHGNTFDVCTNLGKVTVVGTQFNVKARGKRFEVQCYEGKVRVQSNNRVVVLTPGMAIAVEGEQHIESPRVGERPLWMQDQMSFNEEKLDAVIAELERQYDIAITKHNITNNQKFTGTIPADNLDLALEIIGSAYNFKHTKTGKNSITFIGK